jgi:hypothetical protein
MGFETLDDVVFGQFSFDSWLMKHGRTRKRQQANSKTFFFDSSPFAAAQCRTHSLSYT